MIALIEEVRKDRDSIGGVCELVAVGVPPGLGEPVFDKLKADLGKAMLSLPAVTAFEYGAGFAVAGMRGSENNDAFVAAAPGTTRRGSEFGPDCNESADPHVPHSPSITLNRIATAACSAASRRGEPIVCRVAIKPTSSIPRPQKTVTTHRRTDRDPREGPPRSLPVAALRADGRGDDGAGAGGSSVACANEPPGLARLRQRLFVLRTASPGWTPICARLQ